MSYIIILYSSSQQDIPRQISIAGQTDWSNEDLAIEECKRLRRIYKQSEYWVIKWNGAKGEFIYPFDAQMRPIEMRMVEMI